MVVKNVYLHKINEQKYGNPYIEFRGRGDEIHVRPLTFREVADFRDDYSQDMIRESYALWRIATGRFRKRCQQEGELSGTADGAYLFA